jgi:replication factor C subunit 3/5
MSPAAAEDSNMDEIRDVSASFKKGKGKGKEKSIEEVAEADSDLLPWVEKYRPATLEDLVSHKDITSTIEKFIEKSRLPHLLFYGPPGTGKTSTILAMARKIYGPNFRNNVLEVRTEGRRVYACMHTRDKFLTLSYSSLSAECVRR